MPRSRPQASLRAFARLLPLTSDAGQAAGGPIVPKRRKVPDTLRCPCCGQRRLAEQDQSPALDEALLSMRGGTPHWAKGRPGWSVSSARRGDLVWACDSCLELGKAIRAKPWLQELCCDAPRFAYFAQAKTCRRCGRDFVFTALEQRRWYEEFKLPPSAEPIDCRTCRDAKRRRSRAATQLAERLEALDPHDPSQLAEIASLYLAIGSSRKAAEFLRRAKNRSADPGQVAELLERLVHLESGLAPGT